MKHIVFLLIACFAAGVAAQDKPMAKEAAKPEATKEAAKAAEPKKQSVTGPRRAGKRWSEDARHCLERSTNTEIIKCAEEYL
jgi:hypothetical protein